ncbi:DUF5132 domain-containing protein [Streptomyces sp. NPDC001443]
MGLGIEVKRAVQEAGEGIQDLAAEATAEVLADQTAHGAEHGVGAAEDGIAGSAGAATGSAPAAAAADANVGQAAGEDKPVGKTRGAGAVAAKVR